MPMIRHLRLIGTLVVALVGLAACSGSGSDSSKACQNVACGFGTCVIEDGWAQCQCLSGFHAVGLLCVGNLCSESSCVHGHCTSPETSALCSCEEGWGGQRCDECGYGFIAQGLTCVPDTQCFPNPCGQGTCSHEGEGIVCACEEGYKGDRCETCSPGYSLIEEECIPSSTCSETLCGHGRCLEKEGQAYCECYLGFSGRWCDQCPEGTVESEVGCIPEDEAPCLPNPCLEEHKTVCRADGEGFLCRCEPGYTEQGGSCVAETVCQADTTCRGHGSCVEGTLDCLCNDGYQGDHCDQCASGYAWDSEECKPTSSSLCTSNPCREWNRSVCATRDQGSVCLCDEGFEEQSGVCSPTCQADAATCLAAVSSAGFLSTSNGFGAMVVSLGSKKINALYEHPYESWGPNEEQVIAKSRNILYDSYLGLRVDGQTVWLNTLPIRHASYYQENGIAHWVQEFNGLRIESFATTPWSIKRPGILLVGRITNLGSATKVASLFSLHNYHVGKTSGPGSVYPDATEERIVWDETARAYLESGPGGALIHKPLGSFIHRGAGSGDASPYVLLSAGQNLKDESDTQAGDDRVAAFQQDFILEPNASGTLGVITAFDRGGSTESLIGEISAAYTDFDGAGALEAATQEWESWRKPTPGSLRNDERYVYRVNEAILRMGQVWEETDKSKGQILASMPPGMWMISWARDMSYSIVALARSGHYDEARAALEFMLNADSNLYRDYLGLDYQISVCRYYGKGMEESDSNQDGPNIELDGFGLFLWALAEYIGASGEMTLLFDYPEVIADRIAQAIIDSVDDNGMIRADSSIWERHWNGREKQFTYTSLAAVAGLCQLAEHVSEHANNWTNEGSKILQSVRENALHLGLLVQSVEEYSQLDGYLDASVIEAFNWNLFDPTGNEAATTLDAMEENLKVASGFGYFRNDDGDHYDTQEWVFIDLRISQALRRAGRTSEADALMDWISALAVANMGLIPELLDPQSSRYDGAIPMVGFGAAAYMLNLWQRLDPAEYKYACFPK